MTAPDILALNIKRYRALIEAETNDLRRAEIQALLERDLIAQKRLAQEQAH
jgi:hypothetical protein